MHSAANIPTRLRLFSESVATPIGTLVLITDDAGCVRALDWDDHQPRLHRSVQRHYAVHPEPNGTTRSASPARIDDRPTIDLFTKGHRAHQPHAQSARVEFIARTGARDVVTRDESEQRVGGLFSPRQTPSTARAALVRYFDGDIAALDSVAVDPAGTPFQRSVWAGLRSIPPGRTTSYGELAATIGRPRAVRAVGHANGTNPIGLIVPCHRVIGASGALTGYAGGLDRKRWLLAHEATYVHSRLYV